MTKLLPSSIPTNNKPKNKINKNNSNNNNSKNNNNNRPIKKVAKTPKDQKEKTTKMRTKINNKMLIQTNSQEVREIRSRRL